MFQSIVFGLLAITVSGANAAESLLTLFSDVTTAKAYKFDVKDNQGEHLACNHVYESRTEAVRSKYGAYFAVYHAQVDGEFQVRLASSSDLMQWNFVRSLASNADMPQISHVDGSDWVLMVHEQWMNQGSTAPCQLGFKVYYTEEDFFEGNAFNAYLAPLSQGSHSQLEGTPSVYNSRLVLSSDLYMLDADIGFHFNDIHGVDQVGHGSLASFGPTTLTPSWSSEVSTAYNQAFKSKGAIGNIGQRQSGVLLGQHISTQEANIGSQPPTIWEDWRVWLYIFDSSEGPVPTGAGHAQQLDVKTPGGSVAFGNPGWQVLTCPGSSTAKCLYVSYFLFGEGTKSPDEPWVCGFYKELDGLFV